ncbi:SDR family NAD(P)-dependent oxidoreductase [Mycobacterium sp. C31M]
MREGQVAVVTGAAGGIGLGMAKVFARRGLNVVMADVEERALAAAAADVASAGVTVESVVTDVSDRDQVFTLARKTFDVFGHVDVLCNNAGVFCGLLPAWELDDSDWRWTVDVNLWGVIHGIQAFMPRMVERGSGHIVNTSSLTGLSPVPFNAPYNLTKYGIIGLSETLRLDLDKTGVDIGVTVLCPGYVPTGIGTADRNRPAELTPQARAGGDPFLFGGDKDRAESAKHADLSTAPPTQPEDVGRMVVGAIETNTLFLATGPDVAEAARSRTKRLFADIDGWQVTDVVAGKAEI